MGYRLFTDGGARNNPGPAAIGGVCLSENGTVFEFSEFIGDHKTNNEAEYRALIKGLELALEKKIYTLECLMDSNLVVNQINGLFKVKSESMREHILKIRELEKKFTSVSFKYIPREQNKKADELVNIVLNKELK